MILSDILKFHDSEKRFVPFLMICVLLSLALALALIVHMAQYPSGGDALGYRNYARLYFRPFGPLSDFGTVRTYGYPFYLYLVSFLTGADSDLKLIVGAATSQYLLFSISTLWLIREVKRYGKKFAYALALGLLTNPLVLALVTDTLSESLSVILVVAICACLLTACHSVKWSSALFYLIVASGFSFYATVVRPANIVFLISAIVSAIACIAAHVNFKRNRIVGIALYSALSVISAAVILGPQLLYNLHHWNRGTFLPVCRLGEMQLSFGVALIKYETTMLDGIAAGRYYLNPWLQGPLPTHDAWRWYLENPSNGLKTILAHVFNAYDVRYLFTYITTLDAWYSVALHLGSWILNLLGLAQLMLFATSTISAGLRTRSLPPEAPLMLFVTLLILGITALLAVTAVEVRFNAVPLTVLAIGGCYWIIDFWNQRSSSQILFLGLVIFGACYLVQVSARMEATISETPPPEMSTFDMKSIQCFGDRQPPK